VSDLLVYVIPGISDGSVYAIAAIGLVLTYKTSGVFNFAHGPIAAAAAYAFYEFRDRQGLPWPAAFLLALLIVGVLGGLLLERLANRLSDAPTVMRVVATIGLLVALNSALTAHYGSATIAFAPFLPQGGPVLWGVRISGATMIITLLALTSTACLYLFFRKARLGVAMQAVVDNPTLLDLEGVNPSTVRRVAWTLGTSFAAVSGMLLAPTIGIDVKNLILLAIAAYSAAALGLFISLPMTLLGAMVIGIAVNVLPSFLQNYQSTTVQSLAPNVPFIVLFAALMLVPPGRLVERGTRQVRRLKAARALSPRTMTFGMTLSLLGAIAVPWFIKSSDLNQYTTGLAYAIIFASLGLLTWTSGQISLCQLAFGAVGASTMAHALGSGVPWPLALVFAGLVAIPVGAVAAVAAIRLSGIYLAIATFAFGILLQRMFYTTPLMFGAANSRFTPRPHVGGVDLTGDRAYYYVVLAVTTGCCALILTVCRSRLGRLLRALADSPSALSAHGVNIALSRLYVFCISAFLAAVGGALVAGVTESASGGGGSTFDFSMSLMFLAVLAICGRRLLFSAFLAAFVFEVLRIYPLFRDPAVIEWQGVAFGAAAILVAVLPETGSLRLPRRAADRIGHSPIAERHGRAPRRHGAALAKAAGS
jgi:branched-subunit amino acid ABC-type transport system permease component